MLLPIGWDTHTAPEMGAHPQTIIDKQILGNADLLIGLFLHRLGTPTLDAQSGTAHEIESHTDSGKPAMIYFLEEKIDPSQFNKEQYDKLMAFKNDMKMKGLLHECKREEFRENFLKHLTITVNKNEYFQAEEIKLPSFDNFDSKDEIDISDEAKELLIEASRSPNGRIMRVRSMGGLNVQINGKEFVGERNARIEATWEDALNQLEENSLIEDKGYEGKVFAVTRLGYEYADALKKDADILQDKSSGGTSASIQQDDLEFEKSSGTYISKKDSIRYCHKCLHSSSQRIPLKEQKNGWRCNVCDKFYPNPNYDRPTHTRNESL